jgi:integrase/recombinase XerD
MARLEVPNLNREKSLLHVRQGKGRKDRVVPVGARALRWVEKYLDDVRPLLLVRRGAGLFLTGYGAFSKDVLAEVIEYFRMAGSAARRPHLLPHMRDAPARRRRGHRYIQRLLGHESSRPRRSTPRSSCSCRRCTPGAIRRSGPVRETPPRAESGPRRCPRIDDRRDEPLP